MGFRNRVSASVHPLVQRVVEGLTSCAFCRFLYQFLRRAICLLPCIDTIIWAYSVRFANLMHDESPWGQSDNAVYHRNSNELNSLCYFEVLGVLTFWLPSFYKSFRQTYTLHRGCAQILKGSYNYKLPRGSHIHYHYGIRSQKPK